MFPQKKKKKKKSKWNSSKLICAEVREVVWPRDVHAWWQGGTREEVRSQPCTWGVWTGSPMRDWTAVASPVIWHKEHSEEYKVVNNFCHTWFVHGPRFIFFFAKSLIEIWAKNFPHSHFQINSDNYTLNLQSFKSYSFKHLTNIKILQSIMLI